MTDYSELVVFFFILPVVLQILVPFLMLIGFGFVCAVKAVFGLQNAADGAKDDVKNLNRPADEHKLIHPWQNIA